MGEAKCTFGSRMPINSNMLNEIIYREVKHFKNYKTYRPSFGSTPVAGKFYARHECVTKDGEGDSKLRIDVYHYNVSQMRANGPRSKYKQPVTESMEYGWFPKPLLQIDRDDRRLYQPKVESVHTKIETIIQMSKPKTKKS